MQWAATSLVDLGESGLLYNWALIQCNYFSSSVLVGSDHSHVTVSVLEHNHSFNRGPKINPVLKQRGRTQFTIKVVCCCSSACFSHPLALPFHCCTAPNTWFSPSLPTNTILSSSKGLFFCPATPHESSTYPCSLLSGSLGHIDKVSFNERLG